MSADKELLAYVRGHAIGDGNLSNPNGRAVKLRITCDIKYPQLLERITDTLKKLLPDNKVSSIVRPRNCIDVYVHSNKLEKIVGWKVGRGPKHIQGLHIPAWIRRSRRYSIACLRGLFETDGSIYRDRGYLMVNFVTVMPQIAHDVMEMITKLGFTAHVYKIKQRPPHLTRYNIRISKNTAEFIATIRLVKN